MESAVEDTLRARRVCAKTCKVAMRPESERLSDTGVKQANISDGKSPLIHSAEKSPGDAYPWTDSMVFTYIFSTPTSLRKSQSL